MPDVLTLANRFHDALERHDLQALGRIIEAYKGLTSRLQGDIDALTDAIAAMENPTRTQVYRMARYKRLLRDAGDELAKFEGWLESETGVLGRQMVSRGLDESRALVLAQSPELRAVFRDLPPEAVERLLGFLDPQGPLYRRMQMLGPATADRLGETILQSVAMGKNPRALARVIVEKGLGMGLTDALRMARTVQLYSYREATRANYVANNQIVTGWIWYARLDSSTCMSCVAMHGTRHPVDEPLNDHHNGRCVAVPVTILNPDFTVTAGQEWFDGLTEAQQRAQMGGGRYQAYKDGKFDFGRLSTSRDDEVYGPMKSEATLKELIGSDHVSDEL